MAWTANTQVSVSAVNNAEDVTGNEITTKIKQPDPIAAVSWANGTGAGQANLWWRDTRTYNTSGTTLDLTTLAAASTNTGAATFSAIKALYITNNDASISVDVGNGSVPFAFGLQTAATIIRIKPGETKVLVHDTSAAGIVCTTNKDLKIASVSGTPSVTVTIGGLD